MGQRSWNSFLSCLRRPAALTVLRYAYGMLTGKLWDQILTSSIMDVKLALSPSDQE